MGTLLRDTKYGLRMLAKYPTFTAIAVLTLGLGIGAVTAIFSVVNAVLIRPLPFREPDQLVRFYTQFPSMKFDKFWLSPPEYFDLARDATSYQSFAAYAIGGAAITPRERPIRVPIAKATYTLATTLQAQPALGRWFAPYEDLPGDPRVAVISHRLWRGAFGGDPDIVGRTVPVEGHVVTIIGVMPASFAFPEVDTDLWLPFGLDPSSIRRASHFLTVVGRLRPGVGIEAARAEIGSLEAGWKSAGHHHTMSPPNHPLVVYSLKDEVVGSVRSILWLLQAAVLFVLLIACANVSNLLLARAETRSREIAVRSALGADRRQLIRQFLTESVLLGLLGGALGFVLAIWGVDATVALLPKGAPRASEIHIDLWVLGFAATLALATSLLFGLAPILHTRVDDLGAALKEGQRATGSPRQRFRRSLVVSEVALAVILVIGCGLVIKSFAHLQEVDPGFRPDGLVAGHVELVEKSYPKDADTLAFWKRALDEVRAQPGVASATLMHGMPPYREIDANDADFEGKVFEKGRGPVPNIDFWQIVGDDFFTTMGIRLVAGRFLDKGDVAGAENVVVVNEALAHKFYPGEDPIGKRLRVDGGAKDGGWQRIVGVVADVKQQGLEAQAGTEVFIPVAQGVADFGRTPRSMYIVVRSAGAAAPMESMLRNVVNRLDPTIPVYDLRSMDEVMYESVGKPRFVTFLLVIFAGLALLLATVGIYGVMSYSVAQRTRELGIRMALGARAPGVLRLVMREGMLLAGLGVVIGLAGAAALASGLATRIASILYDVHAVDATTFALVAAVVLAVAALACFLPARRATRVDPMIALRHD